MSTENCKCSPFAPERKLRWVQGMAIALGVPVLILPSIGYFAAVLGGFAIIAWMLSVFQGFMQNFAYAELASRYTNCCGLPGFGQEVFKGSSKKEYNFGKFIGGFSAWNYWFTWNSVLAIFTLLISDYLNKMVPALASINFTLLALAVGFIIFGSLIIINYWGVSGGAILSYFLGALSLIPLVIISIAGICSDNFQLANITNNWLPTDWTWGYDKIFLLLGMMAMAQWSACGWETAAIYAPLYKKPKTDLPKAIFSCGFICLVTYFIVQAACTGVLGLDGIAESKFSPMLSLAKMTMGSAGTVITIIMLMASMVLIIQTAILGSGSAMAEMADDGNLPMSLGKRNKHGVPTVAMIFTASLNLVFITLGSPTSILAAAAIGYVLTNGISLFAYVKACKHFDELSEEEDANIYKAPRGWKYVALFFGLLNIPLYCIGIVYLNVIDPAYGLSNTLGGMVIVLLFVPLWLYMKHTYKTQNGHY